jgi:hypothetical protein
MRRSESRQGSGFLLSYQTLRTVTNSERKKIMVRSRLGLKALGLCALVFGLMAIGASGAQASEWYHLKEGKLLAIGDLLPTLLAELDSAKGTLLFKTGGGTLVHIACTGAELINGKLKEGGKTTAGKAKFTGCEAYLNGSATASTACVPETKGTKLIIESAEGLVLIALHSGTTTALVEPETGTTLTTIELGEECSIGETVPVTGHLTVEDCQNEFTVHKTVHLVQEHATLHNLLALGQPATLDGSANVFLGGPGSGFLWAGLHA